MKALEHQAVVRRPRQPHGHVFPSPGAAAPHGPLSPAVLIAVQRSAGNRAATSLIAARTAPTRNRVAAVPGVATHAPAPLPSAPVQRLITVGKDPNPKAWQDLETIPTVSSASVAVRFVIRFWAQSPPPPRTFKTLDQLVAAAKDSARDMPADFADSLEGEELEAFQDSLKKLKITPTPAFSKALDDRAQELSKLWVDSLGPNPALPPPILDTNHRVPEGFATTPADRAGREDAKWHKVSNAELTLAGKKTGSTNLALLEEARTQEAIKKIGPNAYQVCFTCGNVTDATQFEVDHQQPLSSIRDNMWMLAKGMALDNKLRGSIQQSTPEFDSLFIVSGTPGQPGCSVQLTKKAMNTFSNDMGNLMRICRKCNGAWGKSDMDMLDWYRRSPYFGPDFVADHLLAGNQVIARAKDGQGWGAAAREWFATHHLPILRKQFTLERSRTWMRDQLTKQSTTSLEATREPDPVKKQALLDDAGKVEASNTAFLGGVKRQHNYFAGPHTPLAPGSPLRWKRKTEEQGSDREKRKKEEADKTHPLYQEGLADGDSHALSKEAVLTDAGDQAAYRQGYDVGQQQYQGRSQQGFEDALRADLGGDLPAATSAIGDAGRRSGFGSGVDRRLGYVSLGRDAGQADGPLNLSLVPMGAPGAAVFLLDYMSGYNQGKALRTQQQPSLPSAGGFESS